MVLWKMKFKIWEKEEYTLIHFDLEEVIEPKKLKDLEPPKVNLKKGVVLSGRGPIWLYCYLTHHYHPARFIATYDPRLGGAVVVETHDPNIYVGQVIEMKI
jgi:CRISPR-associated protein Csx3